MPEAARIEADEARQLLAPLRNADLVLLAVSGGPDSIALLHLAVEAASGGSWPVMVVGSVDHQLQETSADVAAGVVHRAEALGIAAHVLVWTGPKPETGLQNAAREARYGLLQGLARRVGASHLVTAHTLDDQAETILFRLARGSGPAGLVGMRSAIEHHGLVHLRPLLGIAKARLLATCRHRGWGYVEDPANRDPRHARTRMRSLMPLLAAEGLDAETFAGLGQRLASMQDAIASAARALHRRAVLPSAPDRLVLDGSVLFAEPRAVSTAVLQEALSDFCHAGPPRLGRLEALVGELNQASQSRRAITRTLHGAMVSLTVDARLELRREPARRRGTAHPARPNGAGSM